MILAKKAACTPPLPSSLHGNIPYYEHSHAELITWYVHGGCALPLDVATVKPNKIQ